MDTKTLAMLQAANEAIKAVRANNTDRDIPEVVVVLGASAPGKHGHFAPESWLMADSDDRLHELFLSGESLERGGRATLGTIIHELVHAYCRQNGIKDVSNAGRYHNKRFKQIAEEFGLEISSAPVIGHSVTEVPEDTAALYKAEIAALDAALVSHRAGNLQLAAKTPRKVYKMVCYTCQDPVTIGKTWFENNNPVCSCGEQFELEETYA